MAGTHSKSPASACKEKQTGKEAHKQSSHKKHKRPRLSHKKSSRSHKPQPLSRKQLQTLQQQYQQLQQHYQHHLVELHDNLDQLLDSYHFLFDAIEVMHFHGNITDQTLYGLAPIVQWLNSGGVHLLQAVEGIEK